MTFIDPERARAKYGDCDDDFECEACGSMEDVCSFNGKQLCYECRIVAKELDEEGDAP